MPALKLNLNALRSNKNEGTPNPEEKTTEDTSNSSPALTANKSSSSAQQETHTDFVDSSTQDNPTIQVEENSVEQKDALDTEGVNTLIENTPIQELSNITATSTEEAQVEEAEIKENPIEEEKKKKSGIFSFSMPINQKKVARDKLEAQKKQDEDAAALKIKQDEKNQEPKEHIEFQNYESSFSKQGGHVIKKLQNFKYAPKTRVGFMLGLLGITFGTLALLMVVFPEKHSLSVYKASIIDLYSDQENRQITNEENLVNSEKETSQTNTKESAPQEEAPKKEIQTQKERLREHLIEKYSK